MKVITVACISCQTYYEAALSIVMFSGVSNPGLQRCRHGQQHFLWEESNVATGESDVVLVLGVLCTQMNTAAGGPVDGQRDGVFSHLMVLIPTVSTLKWQS